MLTMSNALMRCLVLLVLWCWCTSHSWAQFTYSWAQFEEDYLYNANITEDNSVIDEDLLRELLANPINLNTAEREELEQLPFLDDEQISALLDYRQYNGQILSLGELLLVWRMDWKTRNYLSLFVYCGKSKGQSIAASTWRERLLQGKHELSTRIDIPLYTRQGQRRTAETAAHARTQWYLGNKYYHNVKYGYNYKNQWRYGFQMEKDAGEPFGQWGNKGFDAYSVHASYKSYDGKWQVAIGDFRVHLGLGLVAGNGFMLSTKSFVQSYNGATLRLSAHTSTSESNYLRGIALAVKPKPKWQVLLYGAVNAVDALLDSTGHILSLPTSGLHRTYYELQRKNATRVSTLGAAVQYGYQRQKVWGVTANTIHYSHPFAIRLLPYHQHYSAQTHFNLGAYYLYNKPRWQLGGELAVDKQGDIAFLQTAQVRMNELWRVQAIARYYAERYQAYLAKAAQSGGRVQNELGMRLSLSGAIAPYLMLDVYADGYYQPGQTTLAATGAYGGSCGVSLDWKATEQWVWQVRYALNTRQRNVAGTKGKVQALHTTQQWRIKVGYNVPPHLTFQSTMSVRAYHSPLNGLSWGVGWNTYGNWHTEWWRVAVSMAVFNSEDGYTRLSAYEPALRYTSGFTSLNNKGVRLTAMSEYLWHKRIGIGVKLGWTHYWGANTIGTGTQQIIGRNKADISVQLRGLF
ncbi:MAG: helix-hairpin-helix domain-containing protein [Bacteroidales bacterium]|nr:helix-hairpin-helix domain-containing protein [Bacteroidales bacterium]